MTQIQWANYIVPSVFVEQSQGHIEARELAERILAHDGSTAYHNMFDLEPRPTFDKYVGAARPALDLIYFDLDGKESLDQVRGLVAWLGVSDVLVWFSGNKGFHVGIHKDYFGLPDDALLPSKIAHFMKHMKKTFSTIDTAIYNPNRKFRLPGSRHDKVAAYKILVDPSDSLEVIKTKALVRGEFWRALPPLTRSPLPQIETVLRDYEPPKAKKPRIDPPKSERTFVPDAEAVEAGCDFLKAAKANPATLSEPEWYAMLGILTYLPGGRELCHTYSNKHPGYSPEETDRKIEQAERLGKARTCESVDQAWGKCKTCPFYGRVNSPVAIRKKPGWMVTPLGFSGDSYFLTSSENSQICELSEFSQTELFKLMPLEYWSDCYGYESKNGWTIPWDRIKSELMRECREEGFFQADRVRGHGVWLDQGKVVIHLGDRLFYDGADHLLSELDSTYLYELSQRLPPLPTQPLSDSELVHFTDIIQSLRYSRPEQAMFLGGWIALSSICGILAWRPHVWLTGEQGAGKSTAVEIIKRFTSGFLELHVQGASTEAGIRQSVKSSAIPVLFDEFESASQLSAGRVEQVVELFRQACSDDGGNIVKGSTTGVVSKYRARFMGLVASIGVNLSNAADRARFTLVELKKLDQSPEQWERLQVALARLDENYSSRFFARQLALVPVITQNQKLLQTAFAIKHSQRFGQQYGTLLAGWAACLHSRVLTPDEVSGLVGQVQLEKEMASSESNDQEDCLSHLLEKQVRLGDVTTSISKLLAAVLEAQKLDWDKLESKAWREDAGWKTIKSGMGGLGIWPTMLKDRGQGFVIQDKHPELKILFKDTPWHKSWALSLARLRGAEPSIKVRDSEGGRVRGTFVPVRYFGLGDEQKVPLC